MTQHTKEPWNADGIFVDAEDVEVAKFRLEDDASHAVACVNACAGINPEAVPEIFLWAEDVIMQAKRTQLNIPVDLSDSIVLLKAAIAKAKEPQ